MANTAKVVAKLKTMAGLGLCGGLAFGAIGVWTGDEKFFVEIMSPVLNHCDPEVTHRLAITTLKYNLTRAAKIETQPNLDTSVGALKIRNPIGIAAGFDKNGECIAGLMRMGFGWVEVGSVTPLPQVGNPKPRVFRLPEDLAVINRYGFNNDGHEVVYGRVLSFKKQYPDFPVGVNLGANKDSPDRVEDYCKGIHRFSDVADYFVINISSPNTPNLRDLQNSDSLPNLLQRVLATREKQPRRVPIFLKVAPDLTDSEADSICKAVKYKGIDGLIVSNTTVSRASLRSEESLRNEIGGLSGKPLSNASTALIQKFYSKLQGDNIKIIGVGGIWDGKDAYEKICAGASAVQIYTAMVYRGPGLVTSVKAQLSSLLMENGFDSVHQAVGSNLKK